MMKNLYENIAYWLEAFDGTGYTLAFLLLAFWLRLLLVVIDDAVPHG